MKKTVAQLEQEVNELTAKLSSVEMERNNYGIEKSRLSREVAYLTKDLASKTELFDALYGKYELQCPERVIVGVLEKLEIPEQVSLLKQVSAKKLIQFRSASAKAHQSANFYDNNIKDLSEALTRAVSGDIHLPPNH